jgi:hypothetical protein
MTSFDTPTTFESLAAHRRAGTIDPVNLKYMLGDIQTNRGNFLHGRLSHV